MQRRGFEQVKNQKGIALMLAIFTVVLITYLVVEVSYDSNVEYLVNANAVHRLKAYYAARSGLELSLLRIKIYTKVQKQFGKQLGSQAKLLDMVWNFPFAWPLVLPDGANMADKEMLTDILKASHMEASYFTSIQDEGSKIDLNDLASESKKIAEITRKNLMNIFEAQLRNETFMKSHPNFRAEELVEKIADWVDSDTISKIRGNEADFYSKVNGSDLQWPPNRAFRSLEELRFVAGMDEEIFNLLKDRVTVFGMRAINPNHAHAEVIMSLDPSITKEIADQVLKRRESENLGGPFKEGNDHCKGDFWGFVNSKGARVSAETQNDLPLACSKVANFKIKSVGEYNGVNREITAIVYDLKLSAQVVADALKQEQQAQNPTAPTPAPGNPAQPSAPTSEPLPKGPPRIVYYNER